MYIHANAAPISATDDALENDETMQDEIILAATEKLRKHSGNEAMHQPVVHFKGDQVHISELRRQDLYLLWKSPPLYRGTPMKLISKGLWFQEGYVNEFKGGPGMRKEAFVKAFEAQYSKYKPASKREGLYAVYARFYQVVGVAGEPIFAGQVIMFSEEIDFSEEDKPFFVKQRERKRQRVGEVERDALANKQAVDTFTSDLQEPANKSARVVASTADT